MFNRGGRSALARTSIAVDGVLAAIVAVAGYGAAHRALIAHYRVAPAIEDLFVACTGRPGWMVEPSVYALPQWTEFLERRLEYFPCDAIKGLRLYEVGVTWDLQRYFHLALSTWFRVVGPTVNGFITFQAASYAITCVFAFLIFRLAVGRIVALLCAAGFVWSSSHLSMVGLPIEYSKAPWALAVVWLCGLVVRRDDAGRPIKWAALALGLVSGVGIGFKPDLIALVPLAVLTPVLFVGAATRRDARRKISAALLVVAGIAIGGSEALYRNFFATTASTLPVQLLGGQDWQTEALYAESPLYDYAVTWDDSYVTWMVNSYGQRALGKHSVAGFFDHEMEDTARRLLVRLWTVFPGDLVLRVIAATVRVMRLNEMSPWVTVVGLFMVFASSPKRGWFLTSVTVYLCAYVSLVFQHRHIFHLEFLPWLFAGIVLRGAVQAALAGAGALRDGRIAHMLEQARRAWLEPVLRALVSMAAIAAVAGLVLVAARQFQQARVTGLVARYRAMPRETRHVTTSVTGADDVALRVEGVSLQDRNGGPETLASDYLVMTFNCRDSHVIRVRLKYLPPVMDWANWNRDLAVTCAVGGGESTLITPIYQYGDALRFDGFIMSRADAGRVASVSAMRADSSVDLWPNLMLPSDWAARSWFEQMKWPPQMPIWEAPVGGATGTGRWWVRIPVFRRLFS